MATKLSATAAPYQSILPNWPFYRFAVFVMRNGSPQKSVANVGRAISRAAFGLSAVTVTHARKTRGFSLVGWAVTLNCGIDRMARRWVITAVLRS